MQDDTTLEALARQAFPAARRIIILAAGDPGGTLFHDADATWQAAGIAATSWDAGDGYTLSPTTSATTCASFRTTQSDYPA